MEALAWLILSFFSIPRRYKDKRMWFCIASRPCPVGETGGFKYLKINARGIQQTSIAFILTLRTGKLLQTVPQEAPDT